MRNILNLFNDRYIPGGLLQRGTTVTLQISNFFPPSRSHICLHFDKIKFYLIYKQTVQNAYLLHKSTFYLWDKMSLAKALNASRFLLYSFKNTKRHFPVTIERILYIRDPENPDSFFPLRFNMASLTTLHWLHFPNWQVLKIPTGHQEDFTALGYKWFF